MPKCCVKVHYADGSVATCDAPANDGGIHLCYYHNKVVGGLTEPVESPYAEETVVKYTAKGFPNVILWHKDKNIETIMEEEREVCEAASEEAA